MTSKATRRNPPAAAAAQERSAGGSGETMTCPLCGDTSQPFHSDRRRCFLRCPTCLLISVPARYHLDAQAEKAVYDQHDNRPDDPGYRRFLARAADAVTARVALPAGGLDFGSGPGPTLSIMLAEQGYRMAIHDPYYAPDRSVLAHRYDFITATEVFEHLAHPPREIERLIGCLRPGGWLVVMTKRHRDDVDAFASWHYAKDPTHIAFFADGTCRWIADHFGLRLEPIGPDVVAFQRPIEAPGNPGEMYADTPRKL